MKNKENVKSERMELRLTKKQKKAIKKAAEASGLSASDFILARVFLIKAEPGNGAFPELIKVIRKLQDVINDLEDKGVEVSGVMEDVEGIWDKMTLM